MVRSFVLCDVSSRPEKLVGSYSSPLEKNGVVMREARADKWFDLLCMDESGAGSGEEWYSVGRAGR